MQPHLGIRKRFIRSLLRVERCSLSWASGRCMNTSSWFIIHSTGDYTKYVCCRIWENNINWNKHAWKARIQQKGITPISTALRAATGIVTMYMVWYECSLPYCSIFYKIHTVTVYFTTVTGSPAITGEFWDGHRSWTLIVSALSMAICP